MLSHFCLTPCVIDAAPIEYWCCIIVVRVDSCLLTLAYTFRFVIFSHHLDDLVKSELSSYWLLFYTTHESLLLYTTHASLFLIETSVRE